MVVARLRHPACRRTRLELEITESVLLQDNEATLATLHQLRALGVRIAHGRFRHRLFLAQLPAQLPLRQDQDRPLASSPTVDGSDDALAIVRAVAGLGISLGIATTAEGVETEEQLERVRAEGCTEMQGYLLQPAEADQEDRAAVPDAGREDGDRRLTELAASPRFQRSIIIAAAITAIMVATMMARCSGLLTMWRSMPNRVPSNCNAMPHLEHLPGRLAHVRMHGTNIDLSREFASLDP